MKKINRYLIPFFLFAIGGLSWAQDTTSATMVQPIDSNVVQPSVPLSAPVIEEAVAETIQPIAPVSKPLLDTIVMTFAREKTIQSSDSTFFNVLKIDNYFNQPITGSLKIVLPEGWESIGFNKETMVDIVPGEPLYYPVRITIPRLAKGGVAYFIGATLKFNKEIYKSNCYIEISKKSNWQVDAVSNSVFFNENFESVDFSFRFQNKGNAEELVKLEFEVGKLLNISGLNNNSAKIAYLNLRPYSDTTLTLKAFPNILKNDDARFYEKSWKESIVTLKASTEDKQDYRTVWFKKLKSKYWHHKDQTLTPLNVRLDFFNLMSGAQPIVNLWLFGQVLFPGKKEIGYRVLTRNISSKDNWNQGYFTDMRNTSFLVTYKDEKISVGVGDIRTSFNRYHNIFGKGAIVNYKINRLHTVQALGVYNFFTGGYGFSAGHNSRFTKLFSMRNNLTYEVNDSRYYRVFSGSSEGSFSVARHTFTLGAVITNPTFNLVPFQTYTNSTDTTIIGYGGIFQYQYNSKAFTGRLFIKEFSRSSLNANKSSMYRVNLMYNINERSKIVGFYSANRSNRNNFPLDFYVPDNYYDNRNAMLTYNSTIEKIGYSVGFSDRYFFRQYDLSGNYSGIYKMRTHYYGFIGRIGYSFSGYKSVGLLTNLGFTRVKSMFNDVYVINPDSTGGLFSANIGASYNSKSFTFNINYMMGTYNYYSAYIYGTYGVSQKTLYIRPTYQKTFFNEHLKLSATLNYMIRQPRKSENMYLTTRADITIDKGWKVYLTTNVSSNTRESQNEGGSISSRNFSMFTGVIKSFDLPQPRLKYYNLKVVCFRDLNGDQVHQKDEPLLQNIIIEVSQKSDTSGNENYIGNYSTQELVTDPFGEVNLYDIPQTIYVLKVKPLSNMLDAYNINGDEQEVVLSTNTTHYVPFGESYKVKGKIMLERDAFSDEGMVKLNGIRVTAYNDNGFNYSTLTSDDGSYVIHVPQAGYYKVTINDIFGGKFIPEQREFEINFNGFKYYEINFKFVEQKRKVNMNNDGGYQFSFGDQPDSNQRSTPRQYITLSGPGSERFFTKAVDVKNIAGVFFTVQIGAYSNPLIPKLFETMPNIITEQLPNGMIRICTGAFKSLEEAQKERDKYSYLGFTDSYVSAYSNGKYMKVDEAVKLLQGK